MSDESKKTDTGETWTLSRIKRPRSLMAMASNQIRDLIMSGEIKLGELISENDLALKLGVSRTPVREALQRLEGERLVKIVPQRGTFVFDFNENESRQTFQMREILEIGALRIAVAKDRTGLIERLRHKLAESEMALGKDITTFRLSDAAFHATIIEASGNRDLIEAYERITSRVRALLNRVTQTTQQMEGSQYAHQAVVDHIARNEDATAEEELRCHINGSAQLMDT